MLRPYTRPPRFYTMFLCRRSLLVTRQFLLSPPHELLQQFVPFDRPHTAVEIIIHIPPLHSSRKSMPFFSRLPSNIIGFQPSAAIHYAAWADIYAPYSRRSPPSLPISSHHCPPRCSDTRRASFPLATSITTRETLLMGFARVTPRRPRSPLAQRGPASPMQAVDIFAAALPLLICTGASACWLFPPRACRRATHEYRCSA